jgi:hypothetical protein
MIIEPLLAIIDRLISLTKYHETRLKDLYRNLFEPTFSELLVIHSDYMKMFEHLADTLESRRLILVDGTPSYGEFTFGGEGVKRLREAASYLSAKRLEFEPVRVKLRSFVLELREHNPVALADRFVDALVRYFPDGELLGDSTRARMCEMALETTLSLVDRGTSLSADDFNGGIAPVAYHILATIQGQRVRWSVVCEEFARLKLRVSASP